jgi:8-oxo-dGTP diphosphatase
MYRSLLKIWRKLALTTGVQIKILRLFNDKFLIGVTGVIFNDKHEVLLVKHTYRRVPWSLPGGCLQSGEHPKSGLQRELFEETNFKVFIESIIKTQHDKSSARLDMCYVGIYKSGKFKKSHEVVDYGFYNLDKLPPLITDQYKQIEMAYEEYKLLHTTPLMKKITNLFNFSHIPFYKK